ncbi:MAG TPA: ATP-binding protein [Streptosporangiaceae bacterium]|nr:ATP-binding protein [Streptosporangiaceae bacterium]
MTNAIAASEGLDGCWYGGQHHPGPPPVRLGVRTDGECVVIEVWDAAEGIPQPQEPEPDAVSGRGLVLVEALSAYHGVELCPDGSGKTVWAIIADWRP